ncbi:hypothetical protein F2Q70_00021337 [Brassica cretica]|uniref:Uncharacterized protein n=1 Tax=Brassica cretica TaxID=69181 RepID=A0A8S9GUA5_BRACR|nr:hypothetical protein F2Q70_00021337 [Brassica cretica]
MGGGAPGNVFFLAPPDLVGSRSQSPFPVFYHTSHLLERPRVASLLLVFALDAINHDSMDVAWSIVVMGWLSSGEAGGGGDPSDGVGGRTRGINNQSLLLSKGLHCQTSSDLKVVIAVRPRYVVAGLWNVNGVAFQGVTNGLLSFLKKF